MKFSTRVTVSLAEAWFFPDNDADAVTVTCLVAPLNAYPGAKSAVADCFIYCVALLVRGPAVMSDPTQPSVTDKQGWLNKN